MNTPLMQVLLIKQVVGQTLVTMTLLKNQSFFSPQQDFLIGKVKPNFTLDKLASHRSCIGW